ncbi:hypothetical protein RNJ44_04197 [Nakaseomyces bracarensis]|uniref:Altered inheritance of mitochondria protein 21 n=1 Tax=Nakaseomyces bracarensis TaxID=273131 RepID=A0ABR4NUE1_9SACH
MFGSGNGKLKRKSFFLFGSDKSTENSGKQNKQLGTPSHFNVKTKDRPKDERTQGTAKVVNSSSKNVETRESRSKSISKDKKNVEKDRKISVKETTPLHPHKVQEPAIISQERGVPQHNPLGREPFRNNSSNPFLNDEAIIPQLSNMADTSSVEERLNSSSSRQLKDSNPFSKESVPPQVIPNKSRFSRPPPPPINPSDLVIKSATSPVKSPNPSTYSNEGSNMNAKLSNYSSNHTLEDPGHKRNKSEAERLVDDIDIYMRHESLSPERLSTDNLSNREYLRPSITTNLSYNDSTSMLDSPYSNVMPLTVESKHDETQNEEDTSENNDMFSFQSNNTKPSMQKGIYASPESTKLTSNSPIQSLSNSSENSSLALSYNHSNEDILRIANADDNDNNSSSDADYSYQSNSDAEPDREENLSVLDSVESCIISSDQGIRRDVSSTFAPRTLRVVNEDRPSFYLQSTNTNDEDTTISSVSVVPKIVAESVLSEGTTAFSPPNSYQFPPKSSEQERTPDKNTSDSTTPIAQPIMSNFLGSAMEEIQKTPKKSIGQDQAQPGTESSTSGRSSMDRASVNIDSVVSPKSEHTFRLVSSYVEELRLKYFPTSNFLENPPNLPLSIKQKNNLIQPKNIKVKIRTNTKQVGIKHGRIKQKLLTLETANEEKENIVRGSNFPPTPTTATAVDHTKEFRKLLHKDSDHADESVVDNSSETGSEDYLNEIPGDDAYDSDDAMAPLREKKTKKQLPSSEVSRNNTVISYYTRKQKKLNKDLEASDHQLPSNISMLDYTVAEIKAKNDDKKRNRSSSRASQTSAKTERDFMFRGPLHVANPDDEDDD